MPMCFRAAYQHKVVVILDCFELFTETASGARNQVKTYSHYKHHQTVEYLIGISPHGSVTFIDEDVAFYQAKLVIPDVTRGKKQLHPLEVENTRKIANVRIHVERVIGLAVRKFRVFDGEIPCTNFDYLRTSFKANVKLVVRKRNV